MRVQINTHNDENTLIYPTLLLAAAMFALGCAKESIPPPAEAPAPQQEEQTSGDVWQTAAYQESTGDWLRTKDKPEYSPLFIAMIDTENRQGTGKPEDRIALLDAYAFLNAKLAHCKSLDYFKEEMYNYYAQTWPGNAEKRKELDDYFAFYQGLN